jgi:hypothetical protein
MPFKTEKIVLFLFSNIRKKLESLTTSQQGKLRGCCRLKENVHLAIFVGSVSSTFNDVGGLPQKAVKECAGAGKAVLR